MSAEQQAHEYGALFVAITGETEVVERQDEAAAAGFHRPVDQRAAVVQDTVRSSIRESGLDDAIGSPDSS